MLIKQVFSVNKKWGYTENRIKMGILCGSWSIFDVFWGSVHHARKRRLKNSHPAKRGNTNIQPLDGDEGVRLQLLPPPPPPL